ncbi:hypothetical protein K8R33_01800 [archaeon]|nr:hypothetical protein [archaeon]
MINEYELKGETRIGGWTELGTVEKRCYEKGLGELREDIQGLISRGDCNDGTLLAADLGEHIYTYFSKVVAQLEERQIYGVIDQKSVEQYNVENDVGYSLGEVIYEAIETRENAELIAKGEMLSQKQWEAKKEEMYLEGRLD